MTSSLPLADARPRPVPGSSAGRCPCGTPAPSRCTFLEPARSSSSTRNPSPLPSLRSVAWKAEVSPHHRRPRAFRSPHHCLPSARSFGKLRSLLLHRQPRRHRVHHGHPQSRQPRGGVFPAIQKEKTMPFKPSPNEHASHRPKFPSGCPLPTGPKPHARVWYCSSSVGSPASSSFFPHAVASAVAVPSSPTKSWSGGQQVVLLTSLAKRIEGQRLLCRPLRPRILPHQSRSHS